MSAVVEPTTVWRRFRAWCEECQDGWQGTKPTVTRWAGWHNDEHHQEAE